MEDQTPNPRVDLDAKLEAEIEAALGDMSLEDMFEEKDRKSIGRSSGERESKMGTVVSVHREDVFVEFGPKSQGICPVTAFETPPEPGERLEFIINRFDANEGLLILSRKGTVAKAEWESLEVGQIVEARCTGTNKGGLDMEIANHRAFMPAGQVDVRHIEDLSIFVGEKMPCEVIEMDRQRARIVLSRRSHMEAERATLREELMSQIEEGKQLRAKITSLKPYGAFADIGGLDGLIHISDLSYERVRSPEEVVKVGDEVEVVVLKVDTSCDPPKVGLGLKQTMQDPYASTVSAMEVGSLVSGKVTKLMPFGAFVELAPGVEGLIHISELSHERVNRVSSVVKEDEVVTVKVLSIDPGQKRIGLSLKQAKSSEEGDGGESSRKEDPEIRKLKAQLSKKFGDNLKGGIG